jgi:hypothetical protein
VLPFLGKTLFQRRHEIQDFAVPLGNLARNRLLTVLFLLYKRQDPFSIRIVISAGVPGFTLQMVNELGGELKLSIGRCLPRGHVFKGAHFIRVIEDMQHEMLVGGRAGRELARSTYGLVMRII